MPKYEVLSEELSQRIEAERQSASFPTVAFRNDDVLRRRGGQRYRRGAGDAERGKRHGPSPEIPL